MCIICYSAPGAKLPTKATRSVCFTNNPDGAGLMWADGDGSVHVRKGLMSREAVEATLRQLAAEGIDLKAAAVVLHWRIATQGGSTPALTHPFPVSADDEVLAATSSRCRVAVAHNGVISLCSTWSKAETHSDTHLFVRDYATLVISSERWWQRKASVQLLERMSKSKLAVLGSDQHCELIGGFHKAADGCWWSNDTYRPQPRYNVRGGSAFGAYDDEHWWRSIGHGKAAAKPAGKAAKPATPKAAEQLALPGHDPEVQAALRHSVSLVLDLPDGAWIADLEADTLVQASETMYVCDLAGYVWELVLGDDGEVAGASRQPDLVLWDEACQDWQPPRDAATLRVPVL